MAFRYKVAYRPIAGYQQYLNIAEITNWCKENVGDPHITWSFSNWKWRFRFKRDYTMFLLRWS